MTLALRSGVRAAAIPATSRPFVTFTFAVMATLDAITAVAAFTLAAIVATATLTAVGHRGSVMSFSRQRIRHQ